MAGGSSEIDANDAATDPEPSGRRAAVQLRNALPQPAYVIEPPKRRLQRELDKQRHTGNQYEAKIRAEQRREGKFRQPLQPANGQAGTGGACDERNPPPSIHDGIPEFLDRRRRP